MPHDRFVNCSRLAVLQCSLGLLTCAILLGFAAIGFADEPTARVPTRQEAEFFETRIRPVLVENCHSCHGPKKQMSGLRLDSREGLLEGGDKGPSVRLGDPDGQRLARSS